MYHLEPPVQFYLFIYSSYISFPLLFSLLMPVIIILHHLSLANVGRLFFSHMSEHILEQYWVLQFAPQYSYTLRKCFAP